MFSKQEIDSSILSRTTICWVIYKYLVIVRSRSKRNLTYFSKDKRQDSISLDSKYITIPFNNLVMKKNKIRKKEKREKKRKKDLLMETKLRF